MDTRKLAAQQAFPGTHRVRVPRLGVGPAEVLSHADEGDRLEDHVRRGHEQLVQALAAMLLEDGSDSRMVVILDVEERVEEARVEKDHSAP